MKIISVETMRALEASAIASGIPERDLMERAGIEAARVIREYIRESFSPHLIRRIVVVAGKGNNGGDGCVIARILAADFPVSLWLLAPPEEMKPIARDACLAVGPAVATGVRNLPTGDEFAAGDLIVDAVSGIGLAGPAHGNTRAWIEAIRASALPVVAIDVPSGLDADTGSGNPAVAAELTIATGPFKTGHFRNPACGRVVSVPIGLTEAQLAEAPAQGIAVTAEDAARFFEPRDIDTHKNRTGRLLVAAGCAAYGGAPVLAVRAAGRGGAGMIRVLVPAAALPGRQYPASAIVQTVPGAHWDRTHAETLAAQAALSDAMVFGPGVGLHPDTAALLEAALALPLALVIDADALTLLARHPEWLKKRQYPTILTPHPGEAHRLLPEWDGNRETGVRELARRYRAIVVLKGYQTRIAAPDGREAVNTSGSPSLATAGSGDVLAGLIGAFLAERPDCPWEATCAAVWLHGRAGELSPYRRGTVADDLPELIARAGQALSWRF